MRDNAKIREVLTHDSNPHWKFAVVYDQANLVHSFHPYSAWEYKLATDDDELNMIMSEIYDRGIPLNPEIWERANDGRIRKGYHAR